MINRALIRKFLSPISIIVMSAVLLLATLLLSTAAQNAQIGGQHFTTLLAVNLLGILLLCLLVIAHFTRLLGQYRRRVMGSRLMMRLVALFLMLTCLPIGVVYYFSTQFLSKGIDSWFDARIEQALEDALLLGQGFLEASKDELENKAKDDAELVSNATGKLETIRLLDEIRQQRAYVEIDLYDANGQVIATSNQNPTTLFPDNPDKQSLNKARAGVAVAKLESIGNTLQYRVLVPVNNRSLHNNTKVLQIIELLPLRYAHLGDSLELASTEYNRLSYLREPLKISFLISLSLITIMTALLSLWLAFFAARRLVAPLRDLAEGTRLVAAGDYHTRLPVKSDDELGLLVSSFNTMISQIRRSQGEAEANHQKELSGRAYLQTVLSHLSSGVLSVSETGQLQTANQQAAKILKLNLDDMPQAAGAETSLANTAAPIGPLLKLINAAINGTKVDKTTISIESERGKKILIVTITKLDSDAQNAAWVVVFDDVTKLVNAQKDAAWGEVARRLAHEIKNPLTPIQLSAERIRRKYLDKVDIVDRDALDRSTRTISEQVETLKHMVDAFAHYARAERLHFSRFDFHELLKDSLELNKPLDTATQFEFDFFATAQLIEADKDAIRQVLNNLLSNALDATSTTVNPHIKLRTKRQSVDDMAGVSLFIEDNGGGFQANLLDQVFEPYITSKQASQGAATGIGLGMAIVKRIIEAHDGYVVASNSGSLAGGSVNIWLPIKHDK